MNWKSEKWEGTKALAQLISAFILLIYVLGSRTGLVSDALQSHAQEQLSVSRAEHNNSCLNAVNYF